MKILGLFYCPASDVGYPYSNKNRTLTDQILSVDIRAEQSGILEGFSKVLPISHFRNGGIKRNWSKIFIFFFPNSMKY